MKVVVAPYVVVVVTVMVVVVVWQYSEITKRAYIKMGAPVQFNFSVTGKNYVISETIGITCNVTVQSTLHSRVA